MLQADILVLKGKIILQPHPTRMLIFSQPRFSDPKRESSEARAVQFSSITVSPCVQRLRGGCWFRGMWLFAPGCDRGEHPIDEEPHIHDGIQFGPREKVVAGLDPGLWLLSDVNLPKAESADLCGQVVEFGDGQGVTPSAQMVHISVASPTISGTSFPISRKLGREPFGR